MLCTLLYVRKYKSVYDKTVVGGGGGELGGLYYIGRIGLYLISHTATAGQHRTTFHEQ